MFIRGIRAQQFRNFPLIDAQFEGSAHFILGSNGQGKTNFLEALGLVTSVRSFRTSGVRELLRWEGQPREARLIYDLELADGDRSSLDLTLSGTSKRILLEGEVVRKMEEILGRFPTVALTSEDIQLLRGAPQGRRRYLDLFLAAVVPGYFSDLKAYYRALKSRNALLRQGYGVKDVEFQAFERPMVRHGIKVMQARSSLCEQLGGVMTAAYHTISERDESPRMEYRPSWETDDVNELQHQLAKGRRVEIERKSSQSGPHRDDFRLELFQRKAQAYGSEGQQRAMVLALRLSQINWMQKETGTRPVILADDILGELDPVRRRNFWRAIDPECQVFASGTVVPLRDDGKAWTVWEMDDGEWKLRGDR